MPSKKSEHHTKCVLYMHPAASNASKYTQVQDDTRQGVASAITKYLY